MISKKMFLMINKDGGGRQFLDFMGGHSCYEGGHRAHGGSSSPPTPHWGKPLRVNLNLSLIVSKAHCHDS